MIEADRYSESQTPISREKEILTKDKEFLASHKSGGYVGILTNYDVSVVSWLYPEIIQGMSIFYGFIEKDETDPLSAEAFISGHIRGSYGNGRLLSNDEVKKIRETMEEGTYSEQFETWRRHRAANSVPKDDQNSQKEFARYKPIAKYDDAIANKRACLARILALKSNLQTFYGEVNYQQALLTELFLSAPFP